jgi:Spy/CpxP family protein refolding chaperone
MSRSCRFAQFVAVSLALALLAADASAQEGRGRRGFGRGPGGGIGPSTLLRNDKVQTELKITDDQKGKIETVLDEYSEQARQQFSGLRDLSEEERRAKFEELQASFQARTEELNKQLATILDEGQTQRLQEITIQMRGAAAVLDPEVAGKLALTSEQKQKIEDLLEAQRDTQREMFEEDVPREERRAKLDELENETDKAVSEVLTEQQRTQLNELEGAPFDLDRSELFRGGFGRGGRGGRGPGGGSN